MKKIVRIIFGISLVVFLGGYVAFNTKITDEGLMIKNSIMIPYTYTITGDGIILNKYKGNEEEVVVPSNVLWRKVVEIGHNCYSGQKNIKKAILNKNIKVISDSAFWQCNNLTTIESAEQVLEIREGAFHGCNRLEMIELGSEVKVIEDCAFSYCEVLETLSNQYEIEYIGNSAFAYSGLREWEFSTEASVGDKAFVGTEWIMNQGEEYFICGDGDLVKYNGTDDIICIPPTIKNIKGGSFEGIEFKEIYIPETVESIGNSAFYGESGRIYIPETVKFLGGDIEASILNQFSDGVIVTTENSPAHQHAIEHEVPFEIVDEIVYPEE